MKNKGQRFLDRVANVAELDVTVLASSAYGANTPSDIIERGVGTRTWLEPEVCYAPVNPSIFTNNHWYPL